MQTLNYVLVGLILLIVAAMLITHWRRYGRCYVCQHIGELHYGLYSPDAGVCAACLGELVEAYRSERQEFLQENLP